MTTVITTTIELRGFCKRAKGAPYLTVDTEFMREKTYYAQLCLIQAATPDEAVIIDPLADGLSLDPFYELMLDESIVKVFHAARQDLEILVKDMGEVPRPLFDSQIAAMVFGFGDQVGYEPLVRELTGAQIDKGSRFTDWSRRPLSQKQLDYALGDVTHLRDVYEKLLARLDTTGRRKWIEEEMQILSDPALYVVEPTEAWRRLKMRNPRAKEIGPIMKLAEWREAEAQRRDVPRNRIIKDDVIFEVARALPKTSEELGALRSVPQGFERSGPAKSMLQAVAAGQEIPRDDLPRIVSKPREQAPQDVVELLRVLLKRQCEEYDVAPKLLATSSDLDAIALSDEADVAALRGWRREVFGDMALKLKRGELAMSLSGKRVQLLPVPSA